MEQSPVVIQKLDMTYREWARMILVEFWNGPLIVTRGRSIDASELPGLIAIQAGKPVGLLTYHIRGDSCEMVTMNALVPGSGIGSLLIRNLKKVASQSGWTRIWLVTTNDNTQALRFYQRHGFIFKALHRNALEESRRLKPQIPLIGIDGIPLRDELELECAIAPSIRKDL